MSDAKAGPAIIAKSAADTIQDFFITPPSFSKSKFHRCQNLTHPNCKYRDISATSERIMKSAIILRVSTFFFWRRAKPALTYESAGKGLDTRGGATGVGRSVNF